MYDCLDSTLVWYRSSRRYCLVPILVVTCKHYVARGDAIGWKHLTMLMDDVVVRHVVR